MPKQLLRNSILAKRNALSHEQWSQLSNAAQRNLLTLSEYAEAECIALYAPVRNETDTALISEAALYAGKKVLYPVVNGYSMTFRQIESHDSFRRGSFGIMEPCPDCKEFRVEDVDLFIVPGVAFNDNGLRIGHGKGFYDRFLGAAECGFTAVGLCHDFQVTHTGIAAEIHDVPMDIIVTEQRIIRCRQAFRK